MNRKKIYYYVSPLLAVRVSVCGKIENKFREKKEEMNFLILKSRCTHSDN